LSDVADFLTYLEKQRDVSPNTVKAYGRDLADFTTFLEAHYGERAWSWESIDRITMRGFLAWMQRRGVGKRSIARTLSGIRTFYRYLANTQDIDANPAKLVGTPKSERYLPAYLDRAQIELLFQMAEARAMEGNFADVRNLAILELFYSTGMRLSELQGLDRGDIDLVSQQVKVLGKGRKQRIIPIGDHATLALRNYEARRDALGGRVDRQAVFLARSG
jgi:integrase/recombinase XerC